MSPTSPLLESQQSHSVQDARARRDADAFLCRLLNEASLDGDDDNHKMEEIIRQFLLPSKDLGDENNIGASKTKAYQTIEERSHEHVLLRQAFHRRRKQIRVWTEDWMAGGNWDGAAHEADANGPNRQGLRQRRQRRPDNERRRHMHIDQDGRLVPLLQEPRIIQIDAPAPVNNINNNFFVNNVLNINNNNGNANNNNVGGGPPNNLLQQQAQDDLLREQHRREAAAAIDRAVQRYRDEGVPEEDFEVILPGRQNEVRWGRRRRGDMVAGVGGGVLDRLEQHVVLRRVVVAVLTMLAALACLAIQTAPLLSARDKVRNQATVEASAGGRDTYFDALLWELLEVRPWKDHVQACPPLVSPPSHPTPIHMLGSSYSSVLVVLEALKSFLSKNEKAASPPAVTTTIMDPECGDGVVHIPSQRVLLQDYVETYSDALQPYTRGVNLTWWIPCVGSEANVIEKNLCFRGVHDELLSLSDVYSARELLGRHLIQNGGDHFDVHFDMSLLQRRVPIFVEKLKHLLETTYERRSAEPVAFRVLTTGPMDGHGVKLGTFRSSTLNQTNYLHWIERNKRHNDRAYYSPPWPFRLPAKRDVCELQSHVQADGPFHLYTTVSLNDPATTYRGGATLFVDHHYANSNPKRRVQRGMSVDGSQGRVIVASGGPENLRCRLPTRSGLLVALEIWWEAKQH